VKKEPNVNKGVTFAEDCEFISNGNDEIIGELFTEMFVEFVNNLVGKEVVEIKLWYVD
jgi:hypothetical protein